MLCCAVAWENQKLRAVLPMVVRRRRLWTIATTCGPQSAEGCDILIERAGGSDAVAISLFRTFLKAARPDLVEFGFVNSGCHLDIAIENVADARIVDTQDERIPYADCRGDADWQSYKRSLDKSYQSKIDREARRLNREGVVAVNVVQGREAWPAIDWLFQRKREWAGRTKKRGPWVFSPRYQQFVEQMLVDDPRFLVFVMNCGDTPVATKFLVINSSSAAGIIAAYNENFKRFSPGTLLDEFILKYLFDHYRDDAGRPIGFDFGPGIERPKLHWSRGNLQPTKSYRIAASAWGLVGFRLQRMLATARRRLSSMARFGRPRAPRCGGTE